MNEAKKCVKNVYLDYTGPKVWLSWYLKCEKDDTNAEEIEIEKDKPIWVKCIENKVFRYKTGSLDADKLYLKIKALDAQGKTLKIRLWDEDHNKNEQINKDKEYEEKLESQREVIYRNLVILSGAKDVESANKDIKKWEDGCLWWAGVELYAEAYIDDDKLNIARTGIKIPRTFGFKIDECKKEVDKENKIISFSVPVRVYKGNGLTKEKLKCEEYKRILWAITTIASAKESFSNEKERKKFIEIKKSDQKFIKEAFASDDNGRWKMLGKELPKGYKLKNNVAPRYIVAAGGTTIEDSTKGKDGKSAPKHSPIELRATNYDETMGLVKLSYQYTRPNFLFGTNTPNDMWVAPLIIDEDIDSFAEMDEKFLINEKVLEKAPKKKQPFQVKVDDVAVRTEPYGIYAIADGKIIDVVFYDDSPSSSYGTRVFIQHGNPSTSPCTMYAHLNKIKVKVGDNVKAGSLIGIMGGTGISERAMPFHLHVSYFPTVESILKDSSDKYAGIITRSTTVLYKNKTRNPLHFIKQSKNQYPTNTKISGVFNGEYRNPKTKAKYHHEGIDFSGNTNNFIPNWKLGIKGETIGKYYSTSKDKFSDYERIQTPW